MMKYVLLNTNDCSPEHRFPVPAPGVQVHGVLLKPQDHVVCMQIPGAMSQEICLNPKNKVEKYSDLVSGAHYEI